MADELGALPGPDRTASAEQSTLRYSAWDGVLVALAIAQGVLVLAAPCVAVLAIGLWWNANTISHNFIHRPFFRTRWINRLFAFYLSLLLGFPHAVWRGRHLAHHAGVAWRPRLTPQLVTELVFIAGLWATLLATAPRFFVTTYLPSLLIGLTLCSMQGYYEHVGGGTVSHHGGLYNLLFFNDGYHIEHHAHPGMHWRLLPRAVRRRERISRWPPVLRWLDALSLEGLERLVLGSRLLQRYVLRVHERAFRRLLPELGAVTRVGIVGGGLFPRTALVLGKLLPEAELVLIDASTENLAVAHRFLARRVQYVHAFFDPRAREWAVMGGPFDVLIIPLAFVGNRSAAYDSTAAPRLIVHDWIWRPRGTSAIVSLVLLKRLNLASRDRLASAAKHPGHPAEFSQANGQEEAPPHPALSPA
jgi:hypothetical protein